MRAPTFLVDFVQWRWTPSVALVAGSLAFVGFAVLVVPDDLGGVASGADRLSRAARQSTKKVDAPAGELSPSGTDDVEPEAISPQRTAAFPPHAAPPAHNIVQSIFHRTPKMELPVEPVDPNPPPPPPPPPPPAPTQTVYTLENPPAAPPDPNAPDPNAPQPNAPQPNAPQPNAPQVAAPAEP